MKRVSFDYIIYVINYVHCELCEQIAAEIIMLNNTASQFQCAVRTKYKGDSEMTRKSRHIKNCWTGLLISFVHVGQYPTLTLDPSVVGLYMFKI